MRGALVLTVAVMAGGCAGTEMANRHVEPPDLVVVNARVVTLDPRSPEGDALAVKAGRFVYVGNSVAARALAGPSTRVVDAQGAAIVPGLTDAHLHLLGEGFRLSRLDLSGARSKAEVLVRLRGNASNRPGPGWLRGRGWDQNDWRGYDHPFPTAEDIDLVVSDRPVVLTRVDGHAVWVNSRALAEAGITRDTPNPDGGRILHGAGGEPSGVLIDNAADLVLGKVPEPSHSERREAALAAAHECVANGLTGVHEPGLSVDDIAVLEELCREGKLPLRVYVMVSPGPAFEALLASGPRVGLCGGRLTVRAVKLYADGALGSRGAALLADYADESGNRGLLVTSAEKLEAEVRRAAARGIQPCIHAIGDRANREVLDLYERVWPDRAQRLAARPRIEHVQVVAPADLPRFAALGVIASMQPTHATSDMPWAEARLGTERLRGAYAWRTLLGSDAHLAFGSDAPVESVRPLWGLYAAVARADHAGSPSGGWQSQEALGGDEALRAFTQGAAYAGFVEDEQGTIATGKRADFVILSDDPRKVAAKKLLETRVLATYVDGTAVFEAKGN